MRILKLEAEPLALWTYLSAAPGGGAEIQNLPLLQGKVDALPAGLDALVVTSDLQGVAPRALLGGAVALLGEVLADGLASLSAEGMLPPLEHTGVVLAGDLFSDDSALVRGASGDVRSVWEAFGQQFRWVVGVAGNHDTFGSAREQARFFRQRPEQRMLDGDVVEVDGLRVGGVSGIIGRPDKPGRRDEEAFLRSLRHVLRQDPALLVLHQGPDVPGTRMRGSAAIREGLPARDDLLVICGHAHWDTPLVSLPAGPQVLNVDSRAVHLTY
ncbi:metallophosphoesterase [Myxococcus sp. AM009]|uniref:metallophosphoesterase family protein n=2 Tax=unclassified Myxococcus TaxID=2648731 RepID=UPI001595892F|nr:metallophosphoesterase [Myxococcus sp. AM010]NVI98559.1 metallophosphoesterase [Myxococcus sp. AM009]NVJ14325.1 metallophosphoesterase [Myxococcus sp. AM010]